MYTHSQKNLTHTKEPKYPLSVNPKKFVLWLFLVSIVMLFAALTSAYIVKQSDGNKLSIELPSLFLISTGIILLSSAAMHWAYYSARKDRVSSIKTGLLLTFFSGIGFLFCQFSAWSKLVDMNVYFIGNASGSFLYVLTGMHGFHLISGLIFLLVVIGASFRHKVHAKNMLLIEMCATYWHFLSALWLYLFLFLSFYS